MKRNQRDGLRFCATIDKLTVTFVVLSTSVFNPYERSFSVSLLYEGFVREYHYTNFLLRFQNALRVFKIVAQLTCLHNASIQMQIANA